MSNLITNGNMETPIIPASPGYSDSATPTGWTRGPGILGMYLFSSPIVFPPLTKQGMYLLFPGPGETAGSVTQSITFPSAGNYVLSFWTTYGGYGYVSTHTVTVSVGSITSRVISYQTAATNWVQYTMSFYLTSSQLTQTLSFAANSSDTARSTANFTAISLTKASNAVINYAFNDPYTATYTYPNSSQLPGWTYNVASNTIAVARNYASGFVISNNPEKYSQVLILQLVPGNSWTNTGVKQTVYFSTAGYYVLSFWISKRLESIVSPATISSQTMTVSIGAVSNTYNSNGTWVKYYIPFTVSTANSSLILNISTQTSVAASDQSMYITGINIAPDNTNLVKNGTFSTLYFTPANVVNQPIDYWTKTPTTGIGLINTNQYANFAQLPASYSQGCFFNPSLTDKYYISQTVSFPTPGNYLLSFWCQNTDANNTLTVTIGTSFSQTFYNSTSGNWTQYIFTFYVPGSQNLNQELRFTRNLNNSTNVYPFLTAISIVATVPVANTNNLLYNTATKAYDAVLLSDTTPALDNTNVKVGSSSLALTATNTQYVQLNDFRVPTNGLTIACWFKYSSVDNSRLFDFGNGQGADIIRYGPNTGTAYSIGTTLYSVGAASGKADSNWHHFVWTMTFAQPYSKTSTHTVYLDNVAVYTSSTEYYPLVGPRTCCYLGKSNTASEPYATGNIDELRIYDKPLTSTEVFDLYYLRPNNVNGLVKYSLANYYPFEASKFEWITNGYFTTSVTYGQTVPYGWNSYVVGTDLSGLTNLCNLVYWPPTIINGGAVADTPLPVGITNFMGFMRWYPAGYRHPGIYQDISFAAVGNYTLTFWSCSSIYYTQGVNLSVVAGDTTQSVFANNRWSKITVPFTVSSVAGSNRVSISIPDAQDPAGNNIYFAFIAGVSVVYTGGTSSINTVSGTLLANLASGNYVFDASLNNGASIVYNDKKVGSSCLYLNADLYQYVKINGITVTTSGFTVACWFKCSTGGFAGYGRLIHFSPNINGNTDAIIYCPGVGTYLFVDGTEQTSLTGKANNKVDSLWHHFAWTMTYAAYGSATSTHNIYIDGSVVSTVTGQNYPKIVSRPYSYIGTDHPTDVNAFINCFVDDFRVYNAALTSNDIAALYNSANSIIYSGNYTLGLSNTASGTAIYDASLNGGAYINTNDYQTGVGSLAFDVSGQYVNLNNTLLTGRGLTFAFWARANNGCGINTVLDYSNGSGGNQKITFGLQNNTPYAQVTNGARMGTLTFSSLGTTTTASESGVMGTGPVSVAYSTSANRLAYVDYNRGYVYYRTGFTGTDVSLGTTYPNVISICMTSDGSRIVWSVRGVSCYYATWNGSAYVIQSTITTPSGVQGIDMTDDGRILAITLGNWGSLGTSGTPKWAFWTGSGYSTFTDIAGSTSSNYVSCAITPDGNRLAYLNFTTNKLYYAVWNGTGYTQVGAEIYTFTDTANSMRCIKFSRDGNILFVTVAANVCLRYFIWNGTGFNSFYLTDTILGATTTDLWGFYVDYSNTIYSCAFGSSTINKSAYSVSNQYSAANFYSTANLNDNVWRHYAWTIDISNATYKYYLNGSLIYTDTSTNYAFPAQTTRTKCLLGTSTDLSLSYFTGALDDYRVYNSILTESQIGDIYTGKVFGNNTTGTSTGSSELKNLFKPYAKGIQLNSDTKTFGNDFMDNFQPYTSGTRVNPTGVYISRGGTLTDACYLYQPLNHFYIFTYTGADQTFVVPTGTRVIQVECWGAGGAAQGTGVNPAKHTGTGGGGGYTKALLSISGGASLTVIVGQGGYYTVNGTQALSTYGGGGGQTAAQLGWGGGSGGGRSAVRSGSTEIITAGGGGCGGETHQGSSVNPIGDYPFGNGGGGGGLIGGDALSLSAVNGHSEGGKGGTQSAGGSAGVSYSNGTAGSQYTGGAGITAGGGGGYYGGGGGSQTFLGDSRGFGWLFGGGGGGSSYVNSAYLLSNSSSTVLQGGTPTVANGSGLPSVYLNTVGNGGAATKLVNTGQGGNNGQNGLVIITCYS